MKRKIKVVLSIVVVYALACVLICSCGKENLALESTTQQETIELETTIPIEVVDESKILYEELSEQIANANTITDYSKNINLSEMRGVYFGHYPQQANEAAEKDPIEWLVFRRTNNQAMLVSKYILDHVIYDDRPKEDVEGGIYLWRDSLIREWLNEKFYNDAFDEIEQKILSDVVINGNNYIPQTTDKVSLLGLGDLELLGLLDDMTVDNRALTIATDYAKSTPTAMFARKNANNGNDVDNVDLEKRNLDDYFNKMSSSYWLRSDHVDRGAIAVLKVGYFQEFYANEVGRGVRPMIIVDFDYSKYEQRLQRDAAAKEQSIKDTLNRKFDKASFITQIVNAQLVNEYPQGSSIDNYDTVKFGNYYYAANEVDRRDIEWLVLDKNLETKEALLISKYIIDWQKFDKGYNSKVTWEECSLRKWLNEEFINIAFMDEELKLILPKDLLSSIKSFTNITTNDRVFCLNSNEFNKYLPEYREMGSTIYKTGAAPITDYTLYKSDYEATKESGMGSYWLRDKKNLGDDISFVTPKGTLVY